MIKLPGLLFRKHHQFCQDLPLSCNPDLPDSLYTSPCCPPFGSEWSSPLFTFRILELILSHISSMYKASFHYPLQKSHQSLCIFFDPAASTSQKLAIHIYKALSLIDFTALFPVPALLRDIRSLLKQPNPQNSPAFSPNGHLTSSTSLTTHREKQEHWCDTAPKLKRLHSF